MRRIIVIAAIASAGLGLLAPAASAAPTVRHAAKEVYIRVAGTGRCVTASRYRAGVAVAAKPCRHLADQRWFIGRGVVRLAGTRLRLTISRHTWLAALELPGSWRDDWRLDRHHHLRDLVLSRRLGVRDVLTLPTLPVGARQHQMAIVQLVHHDLFIGYQGVRLTRAR